MTRSSACRASPVGRALAVAAGFALLLRAARAQTQFRPPATAERLSDAVRASVMRSVARVQASVAGGQSADGRVEQASGFVIDRYKRLVLTSCHILFAEWPTLAIEVDFAETPAVKRAAEPLLCDRALDLAIVHVREFDIEFPRALQPPPPRRLEPGEGVYILGFAARGAMVVPATVGAGDAQLPGLPGLFVRTQSDLPAGAPGAPDIEEAPDDLAGLSGGPLVTPRGDLVGVNAYSSGARIVDPLSGVEIAKVRKGYYYARPVDSIAAFVRQGLMLKP